MYLFLSTGWCWNALFSLTWQSWITFTLPDAWQPRLQSDSVAQILEARIASHACHPASFSGDDPGLQDLPIIQRPEGIRCWSMTKTRKRKILLAFCPAKRGSTSQAPLNSIVNRSCRSSPGIYLASCESGTRASRYRCFYPRTTSV